MNGHYNYIMQHRIIFLTACLLAAYCQEEYQIKVNNLTCTKTFEPFFLNFTSASYGPSLQDTDLRLLHLFYDFCQPITKTETLSKIKANSKIAVVIPRGNCTFAKKTLYASTLGVELLLIYNM
jgi:hypothetical protein